MSRAPRCGACFRVLVGTAAAFALGAPATWAEEPPALRFDPFERPAAPPAKAANGAAREGRPQEFEPVLRSTLIAAGGSLANLSGVILAIGEETQGYRLVEVRTWEAVFVKNGERIRLEVAGASEARR